jgi:hypothetical protein
LHREGGNPEKEREEELHYYGYRIALRSKTWGRYRYKYKRGIIVYVWRGGFSLLITKRPVPLRAEILERKRSLPYAMIS